MTFCETKNYIPNFENHVVHEGYEKHYCEIMNATACIPFFLTRGIFTRLKGKRVMDGGFTNNIPMFLDDKRK